MTDIEIANVKKYLRQPTVQEVDSFIKELGITDVQFERFYKIPPKTMARFRMGFRPFPKKYWHFVYEKIVPTYGIGYKNSVNSQVSIKVSDRQARRNKFDINRLKSLK